MLHDILGPVNRGDNGAAPGVVAGHMQFLASQLVANVDHPRARIRCIFAVREAGHQPLKIPEGILGGIHVPCGLVRGDEIVEQAFFHVEIGKAAHVQRIVHPGMGRVIAHETLGGDHRGRVVYGHVTGVDQVQTRLLGIVAIGETCLKLFQFIDGSQVVL